MFEYFNILSGSKGLSIGGMELSSLLLVVLGAAVVVVLVYALMRMTR
jgi:hypothetical protein